MVPSLGSSEKIYVAPILVQSSYREPNALALPDTPQQAEPRTPEIVNADARNLARQRKVVDVSGQGIFNTLHGYIKNFSIHEEPNYRKIASDFKADHPELFRWILTQGPNVRREVLSHGERRNPRLAAKVYESLYHLPLAAEKDGPLHPETVCAILRHSLRRGEVDIVNYFEEHLEQHRNLLLAIALIPFKILQESLKNFTLFDEPGVRELLPFYLRRVYWLALDQSSIMRMVEGFERNDDKILDKFFQISNADFWRDFELSLESCFNEPFPEDLASLIQKEKELLSWLRDLSELDTALSLLDEPLFSQLLFCIEDPQFAKCSERLPLLFSSLQICRDALVDRLGMGKIVQDRYRTCQKKIQEIRLNLSPPKNETLADTFCSRYAWVIEQASYAFFANLFQCSWPKKNEWPDDLKVAVQTALDQTCGLPQMRLPLCLLESSKETVEFLLRFSYNYLELSPNEWLQEKIVSLSEGSIESLFEEMKEEKAEFRSTQLNEALNKYLTLPKDLSSLKNQV